jgi:hypothetical protein
MKSLTNHMPGARGVNLTDGTTLWIEPGQTVEIDPKDIVGALPDLGKPRDVDGGDSAFVFELTTENAALKVQITDLTNEVAALRAENAALKTAPAPEPGPLDQSIPDLTAHLAMVTDADEVQKLLDAETAGKSRAGAIAVLEARRDELLA